MSRWLNEIRKPESLLAPDLLAFSVQVPLQGDDCRNSGKSCSNISSVFKAVSLVFSRPSTAFIKLRCSSLNLFISLSYKLQCHDDQVFLSPFSSHGCGVWTRDRSCSPYSTAIICNLIPRFVSLVVLHNVLLCPFHSCFSKPDKCFPLQYSWGRVVNLASFTGVVWTAVLCQLGWPAANRRLLPRTELMSCYTFWLHPCFRPEIIFLGLC